MRAYRPVLVVGLLSLSAALVWSSADAQSKKPAVAAPKRFDANNQTAMSEAMVAVVEGAQKYVEKDVEGAINLFRKAIKLQPRNALAQYALGEALISQNKIQEAETALMAADDAASQTSQYKPRIVFMLASLKERTHKFDEAKELWRRYLDLEKARDGGVHRESGVERMRLVDEWIKMEAAYVPVRQRIGASYSPGGDGGAAPAAPAADGGK